MTNEAEVTPEITGDLIDAVRLNLVPGIGPRIQRDLLDCFGSPADVFAASMSALQQVPRITAKIATALKDSQYEVRARDEIRACFERSVRLIPRQADDYPAWLAEIPDPPSVLYIQGTSHRTNSPSQLSARETALATVSSRPSDWRATWLWRA